MKIVLNDIDRSQFMVHDHVLNGETVHLVQPQHIGASWNQKNKIFRSSVWDSNGELISAGFPKFTNWGEKPDYFPVPRSLNSATIIEKLDGSLLIVTKWKGQYIIRTRGTVDATTLDNGDELEVFKEIILQKLNTAQNNIDTWNISYLFEWVSPRQRIVLSYGEIPDWYLVGIVSHQDYALVTQGKLNLIADDLGLKRPKTYTFNDIDELLANVDQWKGKEGVCVYSHVDQTIHKVKSAWYLVLHHMKSELSSFEKIIDVWLEFGKLDYQAFYKKLSDTFDFELANQVRGDVSRICDGYREVQKIIFGMNLFIKERCLPLGDVKDKKIRGQMAKVVIGAYGDTNRASFIFKLLDSKPLDDSDLKKLLFQVLKK